MGMLDFLNEPLSTQRRGGWRQRRAAAAHERNRKVRSKLAERQLAKWCDGHTTTPNFVGTLRDGIEDGLTQPILFRLGCCGRASKSKSNQFRFASNSRVPRLRDVMAALESPSITKFLHRLDGTSNADIQVFLKPSELMQYELSNFANKFKVHFGANREKLAQFWTGLMSSPIGREVVALNPITCGKSPTELANCIPIVLHEDAGPYAKGHSMNIINFSSLLAKGAQSSTKFIIASHIKVNKDDKPPNSNLPQFWAEVLADFDELGMHDKLVAPDGGRWRAALIFGKGDMEMRCLTWGLPGYGNAVDVCGSCLANRTSRPYTDCRPNASWRPTSLSNMPSQFYSERLAQPRHPLTLSPYFTKYFAILDVMHVMDCKGVTSHVAGSVLKWLINKELRLGSNQDQRLAKLNSKMRSFQSAPATKAPTLMPEFRENNFTASDGWHQLTGQLIKAANARHLVPWLVDIVDQYFDRDTDFDKAVRALVQNLDKMYQILYSAGTFLTAEEQAQLSSCVIKFGIRYQFLREHCRLSNQLFFNFVHKVHAMQHLPEIALFINPIMLQCYAEEGAVGRIGTIWKASKHGTYRKRVQEVVLTKLLIRMHLRLIGR